MNKEFLETITKAAEKAADTRVKLDKEKKKIPGTVEVLMNVLEMIVYHGDDLEKLKRLTVDLHERVSALEGKKSKRKAGK